MKKKSEAKEKFKSFLGWVKSQGHELWVLRTDGGGEYTANERALSQSAFSDLCADGKTNGFGSAETTRGKHVR